MGDPLLIGLLLAKSALAAERGIAFHVEAEGLEDSAMTESSPPTSTTTNRTRGPHDASRYRTLSQRPQDLV